MTLIIWICQSQTEVVTEFLSKWGKCPIQEIAFLQTSFGRENNLIIALNVKVKTYQLTWLALQLDTWIVEVDLPKLVILKHFYALKYRKKAIYQFNAKSCESDKFYIFTA